MEKHFLLEIRIAVRALKESQCYLAYIKERHTNYQKGNLIDYIECKLYLHHLSLDSLIINTILYAHSINGQTFWMLKDLEYYNRCKQIKKKYLPSTSHIKKK